MKNKCKIIERALPISILSVTQNNVDNLLLIIIVNTLIIFGFYFRMNSITPLFILCFLIGFVKLSDSSDEVTTDGDPSTYHKEPDTNAIQRKPKPKCNYNQVLN